MSDARRATARELAQRHLAAGDPLGWSEALYTLAGDDASIIPWADLAPNPNLVEWLDRQSCISRVHAATKIGCGLGDDAEELARRGFATTAFDISRTAIGWCRRRHPDSPVRYVVADLLNAPAQWQGAFDLVVESYTLQALPSSIRHEAMRCVASFVAGGGMLLVIARGRDPGDPEGNMPWPLTRDELATFGEFGLREEHFEDYRDSEDPPVRRFRVTYRKD